MQGSILTTARWKAFRLASLIGLGKTFGEGMFGSHISLDIENDLIFQDIRRHITSRRRLAEPEIVHYHYPENSPEFFREASVYGTKSVWLLNDVFVSPKHGAIWTPEGRIFQESVTNLAIFYEFGGPIEALCRPRSYDDSAPLVPLRSNLVYYHTLLDDIPQLLHALDFRPDARILLARDHPRYIDGILSFLGIESSRILLADRPVRTSYCVFVPKLTRTSFIRPCDLTRLRNAILPRLTESATAQRRIYVSRRGTTQRAFANEAELESALSAIGFDILRFEEMSFADQMATMHSASTIVAPHGGGLANLVAAREGTRVIEIMHPEHMRSTFPRLSSQLSLDHHCVYPATNEIPVDQVLDLID